MESDNRNSVCRQRLANLTNVKRLEQQPTRVQFDGRFDHPHSLVSRCIVRGRHAVFTRRKNSIASPLPLLRQLPETNGRKSPPADLSTGCGNDHAPVFIERRPPTARCRRPLARARVRAPVLSSRIYGKPCVK